MIVVDSNVLAYLYLPGEFTAAAEALLEQEPEWAAPLLWRSEFRNVGTLYFRKGILTYDAVKEAVLQAEELLWGYEEIVESEEVFPLIQKSKCSAYDCEFVALALRLNTHLITYDKKILNEFPEVAVKPEQYLKIAK